MYAYSLAYQAVLIPLLIALPLLLAEEKERVTTRYVNITTIAAFFSSVTATTLQTSLTINPKSTVWDVVNLFWLISLVFSVSSGVSSLLGMTWRKSKMWVLRFVFGQHMVIDNAKLDMIARNHRI